MTAKTTIAMSEEVIYLYGILRMAEEKSITLKEGAERIGISQRHIIRLFQKYLLKAAERNISGIRGKPGNNPMSN